MIPNRRPVDAADLRRLAFDADRPAALEGRLLGDGELRRAEQGRGVVGEAHQPVGELRIHVARGVGNGARQGRPGDNGRRGRRGWRGRRRQAGDVELAAALSTQTPLTYCRAMSTWCVPAAFVRAGGPVTNEPLVVVRQLRDVPTPSMDRSVHVFGRKPSPRTSGYIPASGAEGVSVKVGTGVRRATTPRAPRLLASSGARRSRSSAPRSRCRSHDARAP
jgi:hypothetical protein